MCPQKVAVYLSIYIIGHHHVKSSFGAKKYPDGATFKIQIQHNLTKLAGMQYKWDWRKLKERLELYQVPSQITKETPQFLKLKRRLKKVQEILRSCTAFLLKIKSKVFY